MSYDIDLVDDAGNVVELAEPHQMKGGTYALGGSDAASLNVTYNYAPHFYRVLSAEQGIRVLYGKTAAETIPMLETAIAKLGTDVDRDYWKATEGNARAALIDLWNLAKLVPPTSRWAGD